MPNSNRALANAFDSFINFLQDKNVFSAGNTPLAEVEAGARLPI
jgi:hypothetical protein